MSARGPRDPALERALAQGARPAARSEFRAGLKRRFVAGDWPSEEPLATALDAWVPHARPVFREQLRRDFVGAAAPVPLPRPARRAWRPRLLRPVAAAAAAVALFALWLQPPAEADATWHAVGLEGPAFVSADGRRVPIHIDDALHELLWSGSCRIQWPDRPVHIARGDELLWGFGAGSVVVLKGRRVTDGRERIELELSEGSLGVSMGSGFDGLVRVVTDLGVVELEGRCLSVERVDGGVCICCRRGRATIHRPDGSTRVLTDERTFYLHPQGEPTVEQPLVHVAEAELLERIAREHLEL